MSTNLVTDTVTVFTRELRPVLRDPFSVVLSMSQPLFFLALFAPLLPTIMGGESSMQWFVPGIIVMSCLFASAMTGSNLLYEIQTGAHERLLVTPLNRAALLVGRALKEIVPMFVQAAIIVLVTIPFGFDLYLAGAFVGLLVLAAFSVGLGALSYTLAIVTKSREWMFWNIQQTALFPLLLLAGVLLPLDAGPGWLYTLSRFNPLSYLVEAERALFNGEIATAAAGRGALAAAAVCVVGLFAGVRAMRRG